MRAKYGLTARISGGLLLILVSLDKEQLSRLVPGVMRRCLVASRVGMPEESAIQSVYSEAGQSYRYFLSWRERLVSGHLSMSAAFGAALSWLMTHGSPAAGFKLIGFFGAVLTAVLWHLEARTRTLMTACLKAGADCESRFHFMTGDAIYGKLHQLESSSDERRKSPDQGLRHGIMLNIYFSVILLASILLILFGPILLKS